MAIFESFLLGNLTQKVANLVMYKSNGRGIVRGKPLKVKNPRTPEQLTQRAKMKLLVDLSRRFLSQLGLPAVQANKVFTMLL